MINLTYKPLLPKTHTHYPITKINKLKEIYCKTESILSVIIY